MIEEFLLHPQSMCLYGILHHYPDNQNLLLCLWVATLIILCHIIKAFELTASNQCTPKQQKEPSTYLDIYRIFELCSKLLYFSLEPLINFMPLMFLQCLSTLGISPTSKCKQIISYQMLYLAKLIIESFVLIQFHNFTG